MSPYQSLATVCHLPADVKDADVSASRRGLEHCNLKVGIILEDHTTCIVTSLDTLE